MSGGERGGESRKRKANGPPPEDTALFSAFRGAATSLTQLFASAQQSAAAHGKRSYAAGARDECEKLVRLGGRSLSSCDADVPSL